MSTATEATTVQETTKAVRPSQISITGRLGSNCEVKYFTSSSKTSISIAVNENGQKDPSWYAVALWNLTEKQNDVLTKGTEVTVTGEMRFEEWTDKTTGEPRRKLKLHVNDKMALQLHGRSRKVVAASASQPVPVAVAQPVPVTAAPVADEDWDTIPF